MKSFFDQEGLARLDLILVSLAVAGWIRFPQMRWGLLAMIFVPWVLRIRNKEKLLPGTLLHLPTLLFLVSALIGIWAAYDRENAGSVFWAILGGLFVFYAVIQQPSNLLEFSLGLVSIYGVCLGIYFLLSHDWGTQPADLNILNRVVSYWALWRPDVNLPGLHPNQVAGILATILPMSLTLNFQTRIRKHQVALLLLANAIILTGIIFTSSRGAWLALSGGIFAWFLWKLSLYLAEKFGLASHRWFLIFILLLVFGILTLGIGYAQRNRGLAVISGIPGESSAESRLALFRNTIYLIQDFPVTGGGLGSFPGLYSQYMLVLPNFMFGYSHNLYLDIALEQGILGLGSFLALVVLCGGLLVHFFRDPNKYPPLSQALIPAIMASLLILCFHGLVDNPFAENWAKPLLFSVPGFLAVTTKGVHRADIKSAATKWAWIPTFTLLAMAAVIMTQGKPRAAFFANIGAVEMARLDLDDFPTGEWDEGDDMANYAKPVQHFLKAVALDEVNQTANYRLGLIAMLRRDYMGAVENLEAAHRASPMHRGIQKSLGYAYAWLGMLDKAERTLVGIGEAATEMQVYAWWWGTQGHPEYAELALRMAEQLDAEITP